MNREIDHRQYEDIIGLPHPVSVNRPKMSRHDRAAQFSPFAALTGLDAAISETGRLTEVKIELDEAGKEALDERLGRIQEIIAARPEVTVTYFHPDERKKGGMYVCAEGRVKTLDPIFRKMVFTDGTIIPLDDIYNIEGALFPES